MSKRGRVTANATGAHSMAPQIQFFIDYRGSLIKIATHIIGCPSKAEDIVQDAFFRLHTAPVLGLPAKAQLSYIFRTVRNLAIDHYRKQAFEQRHTGSEEEGLGMEQEKSTSPEHLHHYQESLELIAKALDQLPERTRYAFEMYRIHGVHQREIAQELGVSSTLVNFMIRDAALYCRQAINEGCYKA